MVNIGVFINNTNHKKKLEVNFHNIQLLCTHFDLFYVVDEENDYTEMLHNRVKEVKGFREFHRMKGNMFQKINIITDKIKEESFDFCTIILDNYIYTANIDSYMNYVKNSNYEWVSFTDSTEVFYHVQVNLCSIHKNIFHVFDNIIKDFHVKEHDFHTIYLEFLKEITNTFVKKGVYCKTAYIESVYKKNIYTSNNDHYYFLLEKDILPIIDIQLLDNINCEYDCQDFVFKKLPYDFDLNIYKLYPDLNKLEDEFLKTHFIEHGQFECRKYKEIEIILNTLLYNKLNKIKLIKYFDFPETFDFFKYKEKNADLRNLNKLELKRHWIEYGVYEDRSF